LVVRAARRDRTSVSARRGLIYRPDRATLGVNPDRSGERLRGRYGYQFVTDHPPLSLIPGLHDQACGAAHGSSALVQLDGADSDRQRFVIVSGGAFRVTHLVDTVSLDIGQVRCLGSTSGHGARSPG
jgi:hypothetical protein